MKLLKRRSLRFRLIVILSLAALVIWSMATAIAWFQAKNEVNKMFDAQQILFAKRLASSDLGGMLLDRQFRYRFRSGHRARPKRYDDNALAFAIFTRHGQFVVGDEAKGDNILFAPRSGFTLAKPRGENDLWRIFWLPSNNGRLMIAVGQQIEYRNELVQDMVFGQMWVWIAGLPLLITLIIFLITKELKALKQVGDEMRKRSPESQQLLSTRNVPHEILPLVNGLNRFFNRTSNMLLRERRFTSDAAHELRSPLAGLRIQAELAQMAGDDVKLREEALNHLTDGIDRATQLIEQLLTLSRLDNLQQLDNLEEIHWEQLIPSVIGELYFNAEKRRMNLSFEHAETPNVQKGQPLLLSLMLRNVIDNAIKYCPEGSDIKVRLKKSSILVEDNGGGVSKEDLSKLGQRFYRPAGQNEKGSGLGLSIVFRIAELHHIKVRLENVMDFQGNREGLRVIFTL
ncbi:two-component sensor histidine kinase [Actinobacillus succinogenes]|nr:quorum sensing histidine kinase QseC [Actinobacillus succinogenes]PHI40856.1 two-component sensor histidine kinase [Actinobacillus succinogenes]